jgi:hypothetical protein
MERAEAKAPRMAPVPFALPDQIANAGDQIAQILAGPPALRPFAQILAGPPAPKRSNAANPLPEPATAFMQFSKAAPFCQWQRSQNAIPLPDSNGYIAKAGAALPPGGDANGVLANALAIAPLPPAAKFPGAPRPLPPALYEDLRRRARFLDDWNEGLAEPRTYNPHPISY